MAVAEQIGVVRQRALAGVGAGEESGAGVVLIEMLSVAGGLLQYDLFCSALWLVGGGAQPAW